MSIALEFDPGVGIGVEFTDNARLAPVEKDSDVITIGYVGASIVDDSGPLVYASNVALRKESYANGTFEDNNYLNLGLNVNWNMFDDRLNWYLTENFSQVPVVSASVDTPNNLQDSNAFVFGTNIIFPISGRQVISVIPQVSQYYYEVLPTDNRQYSLAANWNYQIFRLTSIGSDISTRKIEYDDQSLSNTFFTTLSFNVSGQSVRSNYRVNLGATNAERDTGENDTGFIGDVNWQIEPSSRSTIDAFVSSEITDTSTVSQSTSSGNPDDVQLSADVIRNSIMRLTYSRADATLRSRIWGEYRKIKYSESPLSRIVQVFGVQLDFPVTQLVSSGVFMNFDNTKREDFFLEDKRFNVGANVNVAFTSKWSSSFIVQYRTRESTESFRNHDEFSAFASLNYGFGSATRRATPGGV